MIRQLLSKSVLIVSLLSLAVLPNLSSTTVYASEASETNTGLPVRTAQEIAAMWRTHMNPKADFSCPYVTAPVVTAPYAAGVLKADYVQDGLNAINFYRYISGLPADIAAADELNKKAAYGSVLLASEGNFGHTPPKPSNMAEDFYKLGYASTSSANIFASFGYNNHILFASIESYMEDSDKENLDRLGHRRWILNPPLKLTGMGQAKGKDGFTYTALQVFDKSRTENVDYRYIPYPARGAFPIEVFTPATAWSVGLNPALYAAASPQSVKVTLKRLRDGKTWQFGGSAGTVTDTGKYFNVENSRYGAGPAVIFRPDGVGEYRAGDRFQVSIDGLKGPDGSAQPILYSVQFVSAKNPAYDAPKFTDTANYWARQTIYWAADRGIASGYPDGTFKPGNAVTEAEFVKMFTVAMGSDIVQSGFWSDAYYAFAGARGFSLAGLTNAAAKSKPITRAAVAELFASAAGQPLTGNDAIRYMLSNGYSKGKSAATVAGYQGADTLTRAEAVQFIKNALDAQYALPALPNTNVTLP